MSIQFNHTIVASKNREESAAFWADIMGLEVGEPAGPFLPVPVANGFTFDFATLPPHIAAEIQPQHYAFLVSEDEFDAAYAKIRERGLTYWADPQMKGVNEINHNDGGRGIYFQDPAGHYMELITVPYGGWPEEK
ncbi:VOC family protein [Nocardia sp. NPDC050406]|uniref:VOC family protein n=1 Tax=Nocardia sp. NPDC050406 TaxID=3364318 RepID=UPI00378972EF